MLTVFFIYLKHSSDAVSTMFKAEGRNEVTSSAILTIVPILPIVDHEINRIVAKIKSIQYSRYIAKISTSL